MSGVFDLRVYQKMQPGLRELDAIVDSLLSVPGHLS